MIFGWKGDRVLDVKPSLFIAKGLGATFLSS